MTHNTCARIISGTGRLRSAVVLWAFLGAGAGSAQFADWTTTGFDAQRSHWLRTDTKISLEAMRKPGFELVWKSNLNEGRGQQRLTAPVLLDFYISYRGFRSLAFIGGSGNSVTAFDADLGRIEWKKDFKVDGGGAPQPTVLCPGGMTSGLSRPAVVGYPPATGGGGTGRGTPGRSGVGEPFEGAVTIRRDAPRAPQPPQAAPAANAARRVAIPESPYAPRVQLVRAISSDGKLHSMYVSNGEEPKSPVQFVPPNAHARGLLILDNFAYVATVNGCGGTENGIWALDLQSSKVAHWKADANVAGSAGLAAAPDGTIYAAAGGKLVALQARTLSPKGSYSIGTQLFTSSPIVFDADGKDMIVAASNDGKLHVVDGSSLAALATTPAFFASELPGGALASWADSNGGRWILAATSAAPLAESGFAPPSGVSSAGAIVSWKLGKRGAAHVLEPGWTSLGMSSPLAPIVVNGVVFALSSGEYRPGDTSVSASERSRRSTPAVLYALDSATGKELWNSGKAITSYVSSGGLAAGGSRVYVAAQDGTQYVFGFPMEH